MRIHANAGMPVFEGGKTVFKETPEAMADSDPAADPEPAGTGLTAKHSLTGH